MWGEKFDLEAMAPNATADLVEWMGVRGRAALSPSGARDLIRARLVKESLAEGRDFLFVA